MAKMLPTAAPEPGVHQTQDKTRTLFAEESLRLKHARTSRLLQVPGNRPYVRGPVEKIEKLVLPTTEAERNAHEIADAAQKLAAESGKPYISGKKHLLRTTHKFLKQAGTPTRSESGNKLGLRKRMLLTPENG